MVEIKIVTAHDPFHAQGTREIIRALKEIINAIKEENTQGKITDAKKDYTGEFKITKDHLKGLVEGTELQAIYCDESSKLKPGDLVKLIDNSKKDISVNPSILTGDEWRDKSYDVYIKKVN